MHANEPDPIDEINVELDDQPARSKRPLYARRRGSKKRLLLIIAVVGFVLVLIGGAVYWFGLRDTGEQQQETEEVIEEMPQRQGPNLSPAEAAQLVTFKSDELGLEFEHRRDWTVVESDDKSEIILSSPPISYPTMTGQVPAGSGVFTLKIRRGVDQAMRDTVNNTNAVRESQLVAYAAPTEAQRHYTNVSFAGMGDAFTLLVVSGSAEYAPGDMLAGSMPLANADFYLVAGGFGEDAAGALNFDAVPVSQIDSQPVQQAIAIIESLKLF